MFLHYQDVLQSGVKGGVIKNTVRKLPVQFIVPFIKEVCTEQSSFQNTDGFKIIYSATATPDSFFLQENKISG